MKTAPIPTDEHDRLNALYALDINTTQSEERFDAITRDAVRLLDVPISTISIINKDTEEYKSCQGLKATQGNRSASFCGHALLAKNIFIVEDTELDARFSDNPMVVGPPFIRFYAGIALCEQKTRQPVGVLCVKDIKPRQMSAENVSTLLELGQRAEHELNTHQ
jgi:GAF domain-containing protein